MELLVLEKPRTEEAEANMEILTGDAHGEFDRIEDFCAVRERKLRERTVFPWEGPPPQSEYMSPPNCRSIAEIDAILKKVFRFSGYMTAAARH